MSDANDVADTVGICQWFHYEADADLERAVELLHELGIKRLRTGVSWADFHRSRGRQWYRRQLRALEDFDVLLCVWHTPPSIALGGTCASPPRRLEDYSDFIWELMDEYGDSFSAFELWNEPNNRYKWDFERFDPDWSRFGAMVRSAASVARNGRKPTVLGGIIPVDHRWLELMKDYGVLEAVDAIAIHGFPDMWWNDHPNWDWYEFWHGWDEKFAHAGARAQGKPIWLTETGLATYDPQSQEVGRHDLQCRRLLEAAAAPSPCIYWYSLVDLDPGRPAIEGFHVDENEYHLGLVTYEGERKPAWWTMKQLLGGGTGATARSAAG